MFEIPLTIFTSFAEKNGLERYRRHNGYSERLVIQCLLPKGKGLFLEAKGQGPQGESNCADRIDHKER